MPRRWSEGSLPVGLPAAPSCRWIRSATQRVRHDTHSNHQKLGGCWVGWGESRGVFRSGKPRALSGRGKFATSEGRGTPAPVGEGPEVFGFYGGAFTQEQSSPEKGAWLEFASQSAIFMGPVGAILLGSGSRWGFVIGLVTQPFWFYTSFRHRQWGIFIANIFYAFGWAMGVYRNF